MKSVENKRNEAGTERGREVMEEASGGGRDRAMKEVSNGAREMSKGGAREGGSKRWRETSREVSCGGQWSAGSCTNNPQRALALETFQLVLQTKNSEREYKPCIVMRRNVLFDRWMP